MGRNKAEMQISTPHFPAAYYELFPTAEPLLALFSFRAGTNQRIQFMQSKIQLPASNCKYNANRIRLL